MSLRRWPVRGVTSDLIYTNVYCAMCNGIDPLTPLNLTTVKWEGAKDMSNQSVYELEWWPAKIHCPRKDIDSYIESKPSHSKLMDLIRG